MSSINLEKQSPLARLPLSDLANIYLRNSRNLNELERLANEVKTRNGLEAQNLLCEIQYSIREIKKDRAQSHYGTVATSRPYSKLGLNSSSPPHITKCTEFEKYQPQDKSEERDYIEEINSAFNKHFLRLSALTACVLAFGLIISLFISRTLGVIIFIIGSIGASVLPGYWLHERIDKGNGCLSTILTPVLGFLVAITLFGIFKAFVWR